MSPLSIAAAATWPGVELIFGGVFKSRVDFDFRFDGIGTRLYVFSSRMIARAITAASTGFGTTRASANCLGMASLP